MSETQPSSEAGRTPAADAAHEAPAGVVVTGRRALREAAKQGPGILFRRRPRSPKTGETSRAGRNLPAAIVVGLALLVSLLVGMLFLPLAFVALTTVIGVVGVWEVGRALEVRQIKVPTVPALAAGVALPFAAYLGGPEALAFATVVSVTALALWRSLDPAPDAARSIMAGTFVLLWVPFLLSFAMLLLQEPSGALKVATLLLLVVSNDTFGYLIGAFFGKHAMAPRISPKKSWEGFAGSIGGAMLVGVLAVVFLLDRPWWVGICLAVAVVAAATAGDLAESMIKRELGVKDMSSLLPGHGGVMDRLDSIVFASPVAFLLSVTLVPGTL
ncbi:phosphatidate cytidylyltransferase [Arthrobacter subterraneus]|uniref:Phosphatidate cytidylyltransferase n=1 Tax=Arthrobacter subterraneus TaxID=335973 RepID=A0A1G8GGI4_9MICC|nr:phosphatidate cytidylyltransferase [Arthrobacter subterraneus]SDH93498.1 phosphatidate cytidylyltransferase [Arthrobacter subterraneus]